MSQIEYYSKASSIETATAFWDYINKFTKTELANLK